MNIKFGSLFCKQYILIIGLFLTSHLYAGLDIPKLGTINDQFYVIWKKVNYDCQLKNGSNNNLKLVIQNLAKGEQPSHHTLHTNLVESLSIVFSNGSYAEYSQYIIALVSALMALPEHQFSPNLELPASVAVTINELGLHVYLHALQTNDSHVPLVIDIVQQSPSNFDVVIHGLEDSGATEQLSVQFPEDWVISTSADEQPKFTWFDDKNPNIKRSFFPSWGK